MMLFALSHALFLYSFVGLRVQVWISRDLS